MLTITIIPAGHGRYVTAIGEQPLVTVPTTNPMYASCRALVGRGEPDSPVRFRHARSEIIAASIGSIHGGAKLMVVEGDKQGLRVVAYRPFSGADGAITPGARETPEIDGPLHIPGHS